MMVSGGMETLRKSTLLVPCGGNKGCLTPNEHPPLVGHYSPESPVSNLSPRSRWNVRVPHRIPDDNSQDSAATTEKISPFAPPTKHRTRSQLGSEQAASSRKGAVEGRQHTGLTPDPPMTTYQRANLEFLQAGAGEREEIASERSRRESGRDDCSQTSQRSRVSGVQTLELSSVRSGKSRRSAASAGDDASEASSPLTERALQHLEKIEEEKEKAQLRSQILGAEHGGLVFGSPREKKGPPPLPHARTGETVQSKHQHLYLPLEEQLKRLMPDLTPATSAPVSDRSHYLGAQARAGEFAQERARAKAWQSEAASGSATARAWYGIPRKSADVRVRLATTKMARSRPYGADDQTGAEMLSAIEGEARRRRSGFVGASAGTGAAATHKPSAGAPKASKLVEDTTDTRSERLPVRRLGQKDFASLLPPKRLAKRGGWDYGAVQNAGWAADEPVDRIQKSRGPSQGGVNIETQMILSPGLLKARLAAAAERQRRRRDDGREPTARESPCAKAFASIQTMSMQVSPCAKLSRRPR